MILYKGRFANKNKWATKIRQREKCSASESDYDYLVYKDATKEQQSELLKDPIYSDQIKTNE